MKVKKMHARKEPVKPTIQTDEAQTDSETRYRKLFETVRDGIIILNGETGDIVDINPSFLKMLGFNYGEFSGKKPWEIETIKNIIPSHRAFHEMQDNKTVYNKELSLITKNGRSIQVEFTGNT